ncbi:hypothetical protein MKZ38_010669 [Zalerion maritima]|uniref:Uncharacterized protein n=1 Tax=Zalerion maritima TaxID=339359 RepID=A0AAD5WN85_9PEZI|nr:hypothetical protein MKZ38_010669 [Zalerion maritima]
MQEDHNVNSEPSNENSAPPGVDLPVPMNLDDEPRYEQKKRSLVARLNRLVKWMGVDDKGSSKVGKIARGCKKISLRECTQKYGNEGGRN